MLMRWRREFGNNCTLLAHTLLSEGVEVLSSFATSDLFNPWVIVLTVRNVHAEKSVQLSPAATKAMIIHSINSSVYIPFTYNTLWDNLGEGCVDYAGVIASIADATHGRLLRLFLSAPEPVRVGLAGAWLQGQDWSIAPVYPKATLRVQQRHGTRGEQLHMAEVRQQEQKRTVAEVPLSSFFESGVTISLMGYMGTEHTQFLWQVNHARITAFHSRKEFCRACALRRTCDRHQKQVVTLYAVPTEYWAVPAFPEDMWSMFVLDGLSVLDSWLYLSRVLAAPALKYPRKLTDNTRGVGYWALITAVQKQRLALESTLLEVMASPPQEDVLVEYVQDHYASVHAFREQEILSLSSSRYCVMKTAQKLVGVEAGPVVKDMLRLQHMDVLRRRHTRLPRTVQIGVYCFFLVQEGSLLMCRCRKNTFST